MTGTGEVPQPWDERIINIGRPQEHRPTREGELITLRVVNFKADGTVECVLINPVESGAHPPPNLPFPLTVKSAFAVGDGRHRTVSSLLELVRAIEHGLEISLTSEVQIERARASQPAGSEEGSDDGIQQ